MEKPPSQAASQSSIASMRRNQIKICHFRGHEPQKWHFSWRAGRLFREKSSLARHAASCWKRHKCLFRQPRINVQIKVVYCLSRENISPNADWLAWLYKLLGIACPRIPIKIDWLFTWRNVQLTGEVNLYDWLKSIDVCRNWTAPNIWIQEWRNIWER